MRTESTTRCWSKGCREQTLLARRHGLEDERSAATFALTAWLLGKDFDRSMAALTRILESDRLSPRPKAQALEDFTLLLFHPRGEQGLLRWGDLAMNETAAALTGVGQARHHPIQPSLNRKTRHEADG